MRQTNGSLDCDYFIGDGSMLLHFDVVSKKFHRLKRVSFVIIYCGIRKHCSWNFVTSAAEFLNYTVSLHCNTLINNHHHHCCLHPQHYLHHCYVLYGSSSSQSGTLLVIRYGMFKLDPCLLSDSSSQDLNPSHSVSQ